jgi:hypothetical protein
VATEAVIKKYPVNLLKLSVERNVADDGVAIMVIVVDVLLCANVGVTVMDPLAGGESRAYVNMYVVTALLLP